MTRVAIASLVLLLLSGCSGEKRVDSAPSSTEARPSILLVTLDTTRVDAVAEAAPAFSALAARGRRYTQAYAPVPQTLPAHASMMTGLYPGGHGVRENGRFLGKDHPLLAEQLSKAGYRTGAFVSAFALARRFGLARGFETWDEDFGADRAERDATATTDRAIAWLRSDAQAPSFLWVHYYDPHHPYAPPEPFRSRHPGKPYLGEVAYMDSQLARLVEAFERHGSSPHAIIVVADHGEGLGEHGEEQHGNLLYQTTMHVPMLLVGPGIAPATSETPVSTRRIFHTVRDWAGLGSELSLRGSVNETVVAGEAMKPFLDYGWQPQVMAVEGRLKTILSRRLEAYDVIADPSELRDVAATAAVSREARATLRDYPIPTPGAPEATGPMDDEGRKKLASLGYVSSTTKPVIRADAPRPADMAALFPLLDRAAALFVAEKYAEAVPLLEKILEADPHNLDSALRLATSLSSLGRETQATQAFERARAIAPQSADVRAYMALHLARGRDWERAVPMLEEVLRDEPNKVPALEALALLRERQGRIEEAIAVRRQLHSLRAPSPAELVTLGNLAMQAGQTAAAVTAFEEARAVLGDAFANHLELGVLYLASNRLTEARDALDRVSASHPGYPMALFKRAQVSVLLREADAPRRIAAARTHADPTTRQLIARERLFQQ